MSTRDGNAEIYLMNADGSAQENITNSPVGADGRPSWSKNGSQIVFMSARDGNQEIYVMGADGSSPKRLTVNTVVDDFPTIK